MLDIQRLRDAVREVVWEQDISGMPRLRATLIRLLRGAHAIAHDLTEGQLTLQAMSLVYTTLLSLVPLLALTFSVLKAFGVHNQIQPLLLAFLAPLGEKGVEITNRIVEFVENIRVGVLGALGLGLLIYTVTSLIQKTEKAFNYAWRVERTRPFAQRFSQYLSVLTVGPVLVFSALGITASLMSTRLMQRLIAMEPFGTIIARLTEIVPYLLVISAFTFLYVFIPNTRVRLKSALVGGVIAGVLWETTGWVFASFIATSTKYTAIYSGFAILIMFLIWLYLSWLILLVGASIAFYHQHPEYLVVRRREIRLSNRVREKLALCVMALIGRRYYRNQPACTAEELAQSANVPTRAIESILAAIEHSGIIVQIAREPPAYLPARPLESVSIKDVFDAVRGAEEDAYLTVGRLPADPTVDTVMDRVDRALELTLRNRTLRDLTQPSETGPPEAQQNPTALSKNV